MKGLLFTELLEMVEESFGQRTANAIVLGSRLSSGGVYKVSRTYHRTEMIALFEQLQHHTGLPVEQLSAAFGRHLCKRITHDYHQYKDYVNRVFTMISKRKATPVFEYLCIAGSSLTVLYNPFAKTACLTDGLIKGYLDYVQELSAVEETVFSDGQRKFVVTLN